MKRILLFILIHLIVGITIAQTTYSVKYIGSGTPSCNPFMDTPNNFQYTGWKVSHGSPSCWASNTDYVELKASNLLASDGFYEKSEGLFLDHNFQYSGWVNIQLPLKHLSGDVVGIEIWAVNGLNQSTTNNCLEGDIPVPTNKQLLYYSEVTNTSLETLNITPFVPIGSSYNKIWIVVREKNNNTSGSLLIGNLRVFDEGTTSDIHPYINCEFNVSSVSSNSCVITKTTNAPLCDYSCNIYAIGKNFYRQINDWCPGSFPNSFTINGLEPCTAYQFQLNFVSSDPSYNSNGNSPNVEPKYTYGITTSDIPTSLQLDSDLTSSNVYNAHALENVILQPGFKFTANESTDLFVALIGSSTCTALRNASIENTNENKDESSNQKTQIDNLIIYPNPSSDGWFSVSLTDGSAASGNVQVTDISGKSVYQGNISDGKVNLSSLPDGIYVIQITNQSTKTSSKIIISRK